VSSNETVLVVEDDFALRRMYRTALALAGFEVIEADDGLSALHVLEQRKADIVVLDLGLPDGDGKDVIRHVRSWSDVPIIILSARDREAEKIEALDLGADDFVNKPFGVGELLARIRTALRHRMERVAETPVLRTADVEIDNIRHCVMRAGAEVRLTPKEFELLSFLARHAGRVVTHRQILTAIWGPAHATDTQYLRVYIGQIRQKIEKDPGDPRIIITEPGIGYRIAEIGAQ